MAKSIYFYIIARPHSTTNTITHGLLAPPLFPRQFSEFLPSKSWTRYIGDIYMSFL
jgi:hypothetical protein